jgi:hypothetical protein
MGIMTTSAPQRALTPPPPPASPGREGSWLWSRLRSWPGFRRAAWWYAGFAMYAGGVAVFCGPGDDRSWGIWASFGYAAAAAVAAAWPSRRGQAAALVVALAGSLAAPLAWLALTAPATPDVAVVARSGVLLAHHATPYLPAAQLAHGGWLAYNPYLPVMALFGLPHAAGLPGLAADPRPWLAAATLAILGAACYVATPAAWPARGRRAAAARAAVFATACPVMAFPLAEGITDPPVLACVILALALLASPASARRPAWPAIAALAVACAMKYTAWPALAVLTALTAARHGPRAAVRFAAATVAAAVALAVALAPAALAHPGTALANTIAYPLGLTHAPSPAQSPLPGHLLAALGPAGHAAALALLLAAGLGLAASLLIRPPGSTAAAAARLALGLALMFALSPDTRFGYFAYPAALCGWIALSRPGGVLRGGQRSGNGTPCSASGRGPWIRRSAGSMATSLMLASRRLMSPSSANSHSSLP